MLAGEGVLEAMRDSFLSSDNPLADRLMKAIEAGQAAGGDQRGQQAAALVVEKRRLHDGRTSALIGCVTFAWMTIRQAVAELRRLLTLWKERQAERYSSR